jgi:hypothetical protein
VVFEIGEDVAEIGGCAAMAPAAGRSIIVARLERAMRACGNDLVGQPPASARAMRQPCGVISNSGGARQSRSRATAGATATIRPSSTRRASARYRARPHRQVAAAGLDGCRMA